MGKILFTSGGACVEKFPKQPSCSLQIVWHLLLLDWEIIRCKRSKGRKARSKAHHQALTLIGNWGTTTTDGPAKLSCPEQVAGRELSNSCVCTSCHTVPNFHPLTRVEKNIKEQTLILIAHQCLSFAFRIIMLITDPSKKLAQKGDRGHPEWEQWLVPFCNEVRTRPPDTVMNLQWSSHTFMFGTFQLYHRSYGVPTSHPSGWRRTKHAKRFSSDGSSSTHPTQVWKTTFGTMKSYSWVSSSI